MRSLKTTILFTLTIVCVSLQFGCDQQQAEPKGKKELSNPSVGETFAPMEELPDWTMKESDAKSLSEPFALSQFEIRPPTEFSFVNLDAGKPYFWIGPIRADETYGQLIVLIAEIPPGAYDSLGAALDDVVGGIRQKHEPLSHTPPEYGTINGLPFVRTTWEGVVSATAREALAGRKMHGIVYLTIHDGRGIQILCQDVGPESDETLKLGKLAALTFRVAPTPKPSPEP